MSDWGEPPPEYWEEFASSSAANTAGSVAILPRKCGPSCGVGPWSKRAMLLAIKEGELSSDGRCVYCGTLAIVTSGLGQTLPKERGLRSLKGRGTPSRGVPRRGAQPQVRTTPYLRQCCDIVVSAGPLELVYPARVDRSSNVVLETSAKVSDEVQEGPALPLWLAPKWLSEDVYTRPPPPKPVVKPLTMRQEFALLKKRLVRKGKEIMRAARRARLDALYAARCARAATQRKVERVASLVRQARAQIALNELFEAARKRASAPLTKAQEALVAASTAASKASQASWEAFLFRAKARRGQQCPHMAARDEPPVIKEAVTPSVPWAHLGITLQSLKGVIPVDGTLGAIRACSSIATTVVAHATTFTRFAGSALRRVRSAFSRIPYGTCWQQRVPSGGATVSLIGRFFSQVHNGFGRLAGMVPSWNPPSVLTNVERAIVQATILVIVQVLINRMVKSSTYYNNSEELTERFFHGYDEWLMEQYYQCVFNTYCDEQECYLHERSIALEEANFFIFPQASAYQWDCYRPIVCSTPPCEEDSADVTISWDDFEYSFPSPKSVASSVYSDEEIFFDSEEEDVSDIIESDIAMWSLVESKLANDLPHYTFVRGLDKRGAFERSWIYSKYDAYTAHQVWEAYDERHHSLTPASRFNVVLMNVLNNKKRNAKLFRPQLLTIQRRKYYDTPFFPLIESDSVIVEEWNDSNAPAEIEKGAANLVCSGQKPSEHTCNAHMLSVGGNTASYLCTFVHIFNRGVFTNSSILEDTVGEMTCNSSLGCNEGAISEVQERMDDMCIDKPLPTVSQLVAQLRARKAHVTGAGESRVADKKLLDKSDIFRSSTIRDKFSDNKYRRSYVAANHTSDMIPVSMQPRNKPIFTPLPRMTEEELRRLAEAGRGAVNSVALDIGIQSHIAQGSPVVGFFNIMDTRVLDPQHASLCAAYVDLGRSRGKILSLPLTNFPISEALDEYDDVLHGLCLSTHFENPVGFRDGARALSYGTLEFQEYTDNAYSDFSRVKDNWDMIAKVQDIPEDRVLAGFSVLGAVSKNYNTPLPQFQAIDIISPPRRKPPCTSFDNVENFIAKDSKRSFRMPDNGFPTTTGRKSLLRIYDRGSVGVNNGKVVVDASTLTPPRHSTCHAGAEAEPAIAYCLSGFCARDAKGNTILQRIHLREAMASASFRARYEWANRGLINPNIELRLTVGSNPLVGLALGVCFDFFGRCTAANIDNIILPSAANSLPTFIFPLSKGNEQRVFIDINKIAGFSWFPHMDCFANPYAILYVVADNSVVCSADWGYTIEFLLHSMSESNVLGLTPIVTLGQTYSGTLELDLWRGPYQFELGADKERVHDFSLDFARKESYGEDKWFISQPAAMAQLLLGHGGVLFGEIISVGSLAVSCALHVCIAPKNSILDLPSAMQIPGVRLSTGSGNFALRMYSSSGRVSMVGDDYRLRVFAVGGPTSIDAIKAPYAFMVHFHRFVEDDNAPPRVLGMVRRFAWATFHEFHANSVYIYVPARLCDIITKDATTVMHPNPLASLIASCGFFRGNITFIFEWTVRFNITKISGSIATQLCFGRYPRYYGDGHLVLQTRSVSIMHGNTISLEAQMHDYTGYTASGRNFDNELYVDVHLNQARVMGTLSISVELSQDFQIFGRSISPISSNPEEKAEPPYMSRDIEFVTSGTPSGSRRDTRSTSTPAADQASESASMRRQGPLAIKPPV
nr:MAG: polyprotein [Nepovirus sp. 'monocotyledonae']